MADIRVIREIRGCFFRVHPRFVREHGSDGFNGLQLLRPTFLDREKEWLASVSSAKSVVVLPRASVVSLTVRASAL
jgi:hypothetical protein